MRPERKKPNPIALDLKSSKYRKRIFAKKKGMASYQRTNNRRPDASRDGGFDSWGKIGPGILRALLPTRWVARRNLIMAV